MNNYNYILFDLDGTLLDTTEGISEAVRYTIKALKLPEISDNDLIRFIGPPIQDSFVREYGFTPADAQKASNIFRKYYSSKSLMKAKLYDGILDVLQKLKEKKMKIAVATYKRDDYAKRIVDYFGISVYCDFVQGADAENHFNKVDIVNICIEALGNPSYNEVVLIGDSSYDAIAAENIGIHFIGVTYGFGFNSISDVNEFNNIGCADSIHQIYMFL